MAFQVHHSDVHSLDQRTDLLTLEGSKDVLHCMCEKLAMDDAHVPLSAPGPCEERSVR